MDRYRAALLVVAGVVAAGAFFIAFHPGGSQDSGPGQRAGAASGAADADLISPSQRPAAPDFTGLDGWLNSDPIAISALRGRVVLIDFWTYSCVNCVNTLPHLRAINSKYGSQGLTIIGVHSPEFDFEKSRPNVAAAVKRLAVEWPVALDSRMATWNAYSNRYWPAEYLVDKQGRIAYFHAGEGEYDRTERAIVSLLGTGSPVASEPAAAVNSDRTPELYAGSARGKLDWDERYGAPSEVMNYRDPGLPLGTGRILLVGPWSDQSEYVQAAGDGHVRLRFHASDLFLVAESATGSPVTATVTLDGRAAGAQSGPDLRDGALEVGRSDLFHLLAGVGNGPHVVDIGVPAGFRLYTFTFG